MTIETSLLDPGEEVIWSGRPNVLRYALGESLLGLVLGVLVLFCWWGWIALSPIVGEGAPLWLAFWLAGLPLLALGTVSLLSPFWMLYRGAHTAYLVTNKRAIVDTRGLRPYRLNIPLADIGAVDARRFSDDHGSIVFKEIVSKDHQSGAEFVHREGFIAVPELRHVEKILRTAIAQARGSAREPSAHGGGA